MPSKQCPNCHGRGWVIVVHTNSSGQRLSQKKKTCPSCKGGGKI